MQIIEPGLPSQSSEKGDTSQRELQGKGRVQSGCAASKDCGKTENRAGPADASFRQVAGGGSGVRILETRKDPLPGSSLALGLGLKPFL